MIATNALGCTETAHDEASPDEKKMTASPGPR
jgi:hypothetical protein